MPSTVSSSNETPTLSEEDIRRIRRTLLRWGRDHFQEYPWRRTSDPYAGLIAEILLQRTRAEAVPPVYEEFLDRFPTPSALADASEEEVSEVLYPLGLHWRVPLVCELGGQLAERGDIPDDENELRDLPGIGLYTAAAYRSFHADRRGVLVDANVVRWICRLIGKKNCDGETRRKKWLHELADWITPQENIKDFNYALLDFTMTICVPGKPRCEECPLGAALCITGCEILQENE